MSKFLRSAMGDESPKKQPASNEIKINQPDWDKINKDRAEREARIEKMHNETKELTEKQITVMANLTAGLESVGGMFQKMYESVVASTTSVNNINEKINMVILAINQLKKDIGVTTKKTTKKTTKEEKQDE